MKNIPDPNEAESKKKPKGFYLNESEDAKAKDGTNEPRDRKKFQRPQGVPQDEGNESVSEFINEGNPNTEKVIQEARENAAQSQEEEARGFPEEARKDQIKENEQSEAEEEDVFDDEELVEEIEEAIENEEYISEVDKNISVTVEDKIVTLKGTVSSEEVKKNIEDKAALFVGHNRVSNYLQVDQSKA